MTIWPVPRALALLLLAQTITLIESTESKANPTPTPDPGGGQTGSNPGTPSSESTPQTSSTPATPATPKDQEKNDKLDPSKFTVLTTDDDNATKENDVSQYELKQLSKDLVLQYEFKDGAKCVELKYDNQQVYKHNDKHKDQFPTSIFLHLQSKRVYLALKDSTFVYTYQDNKWTETEANLVQIDISKKESTDEFELYKKDNIGTYTAKTNVLFQEVIRKKPTFECGSDHTFIQATDPGQYVYKVVRDGTDTTKSVDNVNLYFINGDVKKFHKVSSGRCKKSWSEGGQLITHTTSQKEDKPNTGSEVNEFEEQKLKDVDVKDHPKEIKLRSKDQPESSKGGDQQGSEGSESQDSSGENGGSTDSEPPKYVVKKGLDGIFNYDLDGFECTEVKYENEIVWTAGQLSKESPKMLHFVKPAKIIILKFTDNSFYLYRGIKSGQNDNTWECYKLAKFDESYKSKYKFTPVDNVKPEGNYGLKLYEFGLQIRFKEEFKCYTVGYDFTGNGYSLIPCWTYSYDVHKESFPRTVYCFGSENVLILFEKHHQLKMNNSLKVDPKAKPTDGSSGQSGSGSTPTGGGTPSGGGSGSSGKDGTDGSRTNSSDARST